MMKKLVCLLLLACLCLSSAATAETRTIGLINEFETTSFWKDNPDVKRSFLDYNWRDGMDHVFLNTEGADVMYDYTDNIDLEMLLQTNMLADLSQSEKIRKAVSRMQPDLQHLITDEEGHIYALPLSLTSFGVYWNKDAWDIAGFTEADVPKSYTELLDFLETWVVRIKANPEKNVCISRLYRFWNTVEVKDSYMVWLMTTLRGAWEAQQRYAGQAVNYNDPEFLALAERTLAVGRALDEAEPKAKEREKMLALFYSELNGSPLDNSGRHDSLSHTIPLRITRDQPALTQASCSLCIVRKDTDVYEDVLQLLESYVDYIDSHRPNFTYQLYMDTQAFSFEEKNYFSLTITDSWLKDFQSYTGHLVFYPFKSSGEYRVMDSFYLGQITAQEMAEGLNEFIGYAEPF